MSKQRKDFYCLRAVEFRSETRKKDDGDDSGDGRTLTGYAAVFNQDTEINSWEGNFFERIAPGAFKKTLREKTPIMQFDHGHDMRTGSVPIGKFEDVHEDTKGLYVEGRLFDNPVVEPIRQAIEAEAIDGMSFRFQVVRDEWRDKDGKKIKPEELWDLLWSPGERGPLSRTIKEVKLSEAGPVVFPAYDGTSVGVRSETPDDLADLPEEERRRIVADSYIRRMPQDEDPLDLEAVPVVDDLNTSDEGTKDETPEDAVREDTSEGHTKVRVIPARRGVKRTIPVRTKKRKESVPMGTIEEMRARIEEIITRMEEIADEYRDGEDGELRAFSEEHDTEWDALQGEHDSLRTKITKAEERQKFVRDRAKKSPKSVIEGGPAVHIKPEAEDLHDIGRAMRTAGGDQEEFVSLCRDNARRIAEKLPVPGLSRAKRDEARDAMIELIEQRDSKEGDLSKRFMLTSSDVYRKAFGKAVMALSTDGLNSEERAALVTGVDAQGGYMVPVDLDPTIMYTDTVPVNPIRRLARVEQISGKKWQGITADGVDVSRAAEAEETGEDAPTFAVPEATPTRVQGFVRYSVEIDQDWPALQREWRTMLQRAKDREEITAFTTGTGVGINPQGLLVGLTQVVNTGGAFTAADLYAVDNALAPEFRANAQWLANRVFYNTVRQFPSADGHDLWERIGAGLPNQLLGYDVYEVSNMTTDMTTNLSKIAVFGDIREAYLIVDRIGMQVELVPHVFGANRRPTGERGIYAMWRNTAKVLRPEAARVLVKTDV